jgi:hypothetical protein
MDTYAELARRASEASLRDLGHSALPGAPVQPHRSRPSLGRRVRTALGRTLARRRWVRRHGKSDFADDRRPAGCQPDDGLQRLLPS